MDLMGWSHSAMAKRYQHVTAAIRADVAERVGALLWTANETTSETATGPGPDLLEAAMSDFSLDLNDDQLQLQKWVHDFAADVVRPAAAEWDEREETPWPIIQEAAKIGLY